MSYSMDIGIDLGVTEVGLTNLLRLQLINYDGNNLGSAIQNNPPTSIITEIGDGMYLWHYESFPDDFRGGIKIFNSTDPLTILGFSAVNPEDIEKIQNRNDLNINVGRSDSNFIIKDGIYTNLESAKNEVTPGTKEGGASKKIAVSSGSYNNEESPLYSVKTGVK